jgi:hypothetical protein
MPKNFHDALNNVAEIMQFETWLRFYFIMNEDDDLVLRVPEAAQEQIGKDFPHLVPLLEDMNNATMSYEKSINTVCQFVVTSLDGGHYPAGVVTSVFDSPEFQKEMQLFRFWTQIHEEQLEQAPMEFNTWKKLFAEWKNSEQVREHVEAIDKDAQRVAQCSTNTVQ